MATCSLLTLNCFGIPTLWTHKRLLTLAHELNQRQATLVCLQEVQTHAYRRLLTQACTAYPSHAHEPFIHAPKGGLLTLGRAPFAHSQFILYHERGLWYTPGLADWMLHKGMLCTTLHLDGLPIHLLNTHLHANYDGDWRPHNRFARSEWRQLQQLAAVVAAQPAEALVLVAGDFNIPRGSWLYHDFLQASHLTDPLANDTRPTFRGLPRLPHRFVQPIDFVLFRPPAALQLQAHADLVFQDKHPFTGGGDGYLSDHCGIVLHLTWNHTARTLPTPQPSPLHQRLTQ